MQAQRDLSVVQRFTVVDKSDFSPSGLTAEVIRMILDAYFDVQFSTHSHGFRTGRGCHTALRDIYYTWGGTTWITLA